MSAAVAAAAAAKSAGVAAAAADGRRTTRSRGRGRKLALIVDSNTLTQRLTSVALYRSGFTSCDVATVGESAVQMARAMRYDLILMESALPTISGTDTARAIRFYEEQAGEPPVTILALTSAVDGASLAAYEAAKMSGAIERGAVVAEAVTEAVEALSRNGNFFFVAASGSKQQSIAQAPLQPLAIPTGAAHARAASASPHSASPYVVSPSPSPSHLSSSSLSTARPALPRALSHAGNNGGNGSAALSPRHPLHGRMPSTSLRRRATGTTHGALAAVTTTTTAAAAAAAAHSIHIESATATSASSATSTPALSPSSAPTPTASA
jgi:CheY-like chemotaxis protein